MQYMGRAIQSLNLRAAARATGATTFDAALAALEYLPRMFVEPDGSFVWVGHNGEARWQVDGNLYDRGDELAYVQMQGECPPAAFDELLTCFGWPETELVFQLVQEGVVVDESTFRRLAAP